MVDERERSEGILVNDSTEGQAATGSAPVIPSFFARNPEVPANVPESTDAVSAFITRSMDPDAEPDAIEDDTLIPPAPRSFSEVGLSKAFLTDLTLKIIHYSGTPSMAQLVRRLGLSQEIVSQLLSALAEERLVEILSQSDLYTGNYRYRLSERGQSRVAEALERTRYAGPCPVTAEQYTEVIKRLIEYKQDTGSRARIKGVLHDLVLPADTTDSLARALYSGRSTIIHGPSGNGKTVLLEHYCQEMGGFSLVPYAIYAYGQVIRVFDQSIHQPLDPDGESNNLKDDLKRDRRWVTIRRPAIVLGAEMDRDALDLGYDPTARFYQAPPHMKATNGALIIDDFGRQQIPTRDLLTRWLIPMERGWDSLSLITGEKLVVPFKLQLLFSTNMAIKDLADEALLRRILYKVQIPNPDPQSFAEILRRACRARQITVEDGALDYAVGKMFARSTHRPRGSHARDILEIIIESASFDSREPVFDRESFDHAFQLFMMHEADSTDEE
jgi:DNA-binding transcriptional ArsR family regulator